MPDTDNTTGETVQGQTLTMADAQAIMAQNNRLRRLLERVLEASIARGCPPEHPRIQLVYDIQGALWTEGRGML